jgi:DNA polymerase
MSDAAATPPHADPRRLARTAALLRLRLELEGRAGLAALPRAAVLPPAQRPSGDGREPAEAPEAAARHACATPAAPATPAEMASELSEELAERAAIAEDAREAGDEGTLPHVTTVKGPGLFDLTSSDTADGTSREDALARIAAEVAQCTRCPELVACRTHTVPGAGSPYAKLVFIGEGPGQNEDEQGLPFVGRAGELLTKMIEAINLTRDEVFIANVVKCRPPGNRQPMPDECANCAPYLARQLAVIQPKVIVALGGTAAKHLLQTHDGITRLRGRFYPYGGIQLMPTFHPAYLLRNYTPDTRRKVYDDLLKARELLDA